MFSVFCSVAISSDVAVIKCTIAARKDAAQAHGFAMHTEAVTRKLTQSGLPFDTLTDEQIIAGKLTGYKLAIFPFNTVSQPDEINRSLPSSTAAVNSCGSTPIPRISPPYWASKTADIGPRSTTANST